jgi:predicted O-methyltransferase YrrM
VGIRARLDIRKALRDRLVRVVDESVARHTEAQTEDLLARLRAEFRHEADRVLDELRAVEIRDRHDTFAAAEREAVASTARFVQREMTGARDFRHPHDTLEHALSLAPTGGMALEFGVWTGTTLKIIAARRAGAVYGFDSFAGLPEDWRAGFASGTFGVETLPEVPGAELVVGLFDDTLPGFLDAHPGPVDFLHIDADLYSSAVTVLEQVGPRLRPGSVVVFDEFFNFPGWEAHEARAWAEYVAARDVGFRYEAYTLDNEQVVIRLT